MSKVIAETQMSDEEARAFIISKLSSTYSHGASWSGSRMGLHAAFIVAAIIVIIVVVKNRDKDDDDKKDECEYEWSNDECCPVY